MAFGTRKYFCKFIISQICWFRPLNFNSFANIFHNIKTKRTKNELTKSIRSCYQICAASFVQKIVNLKVTRDL